MLKKSTILILTLAMVGPLLFTAGCQSDGGNAALVGTAIGAGVGALAGADT